MAATPRASLERDRTYYQREAYRYNQALNDLAKDLPELLDMEAHSVHVSTYSISFYDIEGEHPGLGVKLLALADEDHVDYVVNSGGYTVGEYHIGGMIVRHYNNKVEHPCYRAIIQQEVTWCGTTPPSGEIIEYLKKPGDDVAE